MSVGTGRRRRQNGGRRTDTNLLGHAARKIVRIAAKLTRLPVETVAQQARIPLVLAGSTKAALDRDWSDPEQRSDALGQLVHQLASLQSWLDRTHLAQDDGVAPYIEAME